MSIDAALWPYLLVILAGFLPTEIWRSAAVLLAHGLDEDSEWLIYVRAVATALVAGVITRIVLVPTGDLVAVPLLIRVGAVGGGFLVFFVAQRSMLLGVLAGETIMIAGAWFTQAQ
ncbi:MAG TPA: AzlD domain-containing protein [Xanthobacteraceae bacterium]|jgi:hypothetical protein|nr:AzlD domain-containing protein [Xanthobacteraceae bacterium]